MITSTSNAKIKRIVQLRKKKKARDAEGVFLVEGIRMFREIPEKLLQEIYISESCEEKEGKEIRRRASACGIRPELVSDGVFAYLSDTQTAAGDPVRGWVSFPTAWKKLRTPRARICWCWTGCRIRAMWERSFGLRKAQALQASCWMASVRIFIIPRRYGLRWDPSSGCVLLHPGPGRRDPLSEKTGNLYLCGAPGGKTGI